MDNEYFMPLKPDYPLSFTMNFPQFEESNTFVRSIMSPLEPQDISMNVNFNKSSENESKRKGDSAWILSGRCITMIFNGLIFIFSIGLLIFAMYLIIFNDYEYPMLIFLQIFGRFFFRGIIGYMIFYSVLLIIATSCSSFGVFRDSYLMILFGTSIILMAFGLAIIFPTVLRSFIEKLEIYMRMSIRDYDNNSDSPVTIFWNELQTKYSCCGLNDSISDYRDSYFHRLTGLHLPESCCRSTITSCSNHPTIDNSYLNISCIPSIKHYLDLIFLGHIILLICILINMGFIVLYIKIRF